MVQDRHFRLPIDWRDLHGEAFDGVRVLITGGAGFLGSHLVDALLALDAEVVILDDLTTATPAHLNSTDDTEFVDGSALDHELLTACMENCRYVFHLAALLGEAESNRQPWLYHAVNDWGTLNVLEAARRTRVGRLIYAGSRTAYGDGPVPCDETSAIRPLSCYAATKAAGEGLVSAFAAAHKIDAVSLRFFDIFGPRQRDGGDYAPCVSAIAHGLVNRQAPTLPGDADLTRDYLFVGDAVHAALLAARSMRPFSGEQVNIGGGAGVAARDLLQAMVRCAGCDDVTPTYDAAQCAAPYHSVAATTRGQRLLGYKPVVGFNDGLRMTLQWYGADLPD